MAMAGTGTKSARGAVPGGPVAVSGRAVKALSAAVDDTGEGSAVAGSPDKRQRDTKNDATTTGGTILSVRISKEELHAFDAMVAELGYRSRSDALRAMIRVGSGFLEFSREDAEALLEVQHELHKIGVNVNQIALAANRRRVNLVQTQWQDLNELRAVLPSVRTLLKQMNDEHRRRGVALFRHQSEGGAHG
jgi:Arc/MetJ-type ribon-helix-helix transcriptional regulator